MKSLRQSFREPLKKPHFHEAICPVSQYDYWLVTFRKSLFQTILRNQGQFNLRSLKYLFKETRTLLSECKEFSSKI